MNANIKRLWSLVICLLAAVYPLSAAETPPVPKSFSAYIGGWEGPCYHIDLRDGALIYATKPAFTREPPKPVVRVRINPTAAQWREFRRTLDELKVWKWRADYTDKQIEDGTQWKLSLQYADRQIKTEGSNDYPPNFQVFREAVEKLLGGKPFE